MKKCRKKKPRTLVIRRTDPLLGAACDAGLARADTLGLWPLRLSTDPEKNLPLALRIAELSSQPNYALSALSLADKMHADITWVIEEFLYDIKWSIIADRCSLDVALSERAQLLPRLEGQHGCMVVGCCPEKILDQGLVDDPTFLAQELAAFADYVLTWRSK